MSADRGQAGGDGAETARERPAWARAVEDVVARFEVEPEQGLTGREAKRRRKRHGANRLRETKRSSWARILLNQLESLVVWLLAAAGAASLLFAKWLEAMAIGVVIIINTAIGFFTELRAVRSMEALRRLGRVRTRVRRDGAMDEIDASRLVPGDIVAVEAGDVVAADMRVIEASKLQANESALTGESIPVTKSTAPVDAEAPVAERSCMLFKGSSVTRGSGFGVVVATGMETELGRVAALAEEAEQTVTPLERRLHGLAGKLTWVALSVATVTAIVGAVQGRSAVVMVETGVALAVAAIPEGLPIVATLALARGMWRMARRNALINRLAAVETLGATSVILTDKTGTLTENQMTVSRIALAERDIEVTGRGLEPSGSFRAEGGDIDAAEAPALRALLEVGALCNNASVETGEDTDAVGDPMEVALLVAAGKAGIRRPDLLERAPERREEAFDPETMSMATYHEEDGRVRVAVKGAPEAVIDACSRVRAGDDARALDGEEREAWVERATEMAASGLRMLAGAEKRVDSTDARPYEDLTLLGLYGMHDPPREEVKASLESCRDAGVRVVMVTGDQAGTARSVGEALGLVADGEETEVIEGADLPAPEEMAEEDRERLLAASIFARVAPEQKLRLIELHQEAGRIVAMTGDGVNDAPALRKADIGVAMGRRGTQVAREAADMVLQDDSFPTIVSAIGQGRVIFRNIRRFVVYLLSLHMSEILVVFGASAVGAPLPLLPLQILYLNIVTEIFPAMALGFGEGDERVLRDEPRDPEEPVITRRHWLAAGASALMIGGASLGAFAIALARLEFETDRAVTVSFLTLALAQVWHVFTMRGPGSRPIHNDVVRSPWVWGAVGLCVALLLSSVYLPWLSGALGTRDPGMIGWGVALGMSLLPAIVAQGWIAWVGRGGSRRNSRSEERRAGE